MYPDGDYIDVFFDSESTDGTITVTDLGETIRWLRMQSATSKKSAKQRQMIDDICLTHNVEFFRGQLQARLRPTDNPAAIITRVCQAALRTSDLWFTFRSRGVESTATEVEALLAEERIDFETNVTRIGRSGKSWPIQFQTRTPKRSSLIYVLTTASRGATRRITDHVVATWHDLSHFTVGQEGLHFVSLFDDTSDVWSPEDFRQLDDISDVVLWSDPDRLTQTLKAA